LADQNDTRAVAEALIDSNLYLVLGTANAAGQPWVSPVYYAPAAFREFFWVSSPETKHSRNIEARHEVSIVIFDSSVPINTGQAVYISAIAQKLDGDERLQGIDVFSRRSLAHGGREWTLDDVQAAAPLRLYRATAVDLYVLGEGDRRVKVEIGPL
jgi:nitroimidazol reductase NimA-like FMN-containing flavoprotein (pyridoxamine 5'-phosphate oxidase superfamily)